MRLLEFTEFKKKAIFTAGLPGSGKSTVVTKLTSDLGLPVIDVDKFYNLDLLKGKTAGDYDRYSEKAGKQLDLHVRRNKALVLDGTGTNVTRYAQTKKQLENLGYDCLLLFVATDLDHAEQRAERRAQATGRTVDVASYYQSLVKSFDNLTRLFDRNIVMIDNNPARPDLLTAHRKILNFLRS